MKFQLSPAPRSAGSIRKGNFPSHRSLKRKRGVGEHPKSSRVGCLPRLRPLRPPTSLPPNPSLALQASSMFALMGDLEVRVPNGVSGQGFRTPAKRRQNLNRCRERPMADAGTEAGSLLWSLEVTHYVRVAADSDPTDAATRKT